MPHFTLRVDFAPDRRIGPGKILLLERIRESGSIAAAGRSMEMSYRRAWLLIDDMNRMFREPVVITKLGGSAGGGAKLTEFGERLVAAYRDVERHAHDVFGPRFADLEDALAPLSDKPAKS
jgi:molybdate transport system regulatory protein